MGARLRWLGDTELERARRRAQGAVKRGGAMILVRARLLASRPAKRIRKRRRRTTSAGRKGSQYTVFVPSDPGTPPKLRTGFGRRSILMEFDAERIVARIGPTVNAAYMAYLELGTDRIQPRPWLRPAIDQCMPAIRILLKAALKP